MTDLTFYDAAFPPATPPACDGVCIYIGGDTVHVWTPEEIGMQPARYRLPVFVRSNPRGVSGVAADVNAAILHLTAIGAPKGTLVAWDVETAADKAYIAGVYAGLAAHGYVLIMYGSQSTVMGNDVPDGLYWGADWTSHPHLARGDSMTQWVSFSGYDLDLAESSLPFWDTQPKPLKPPPKPAPPSVPAWQEAIMNKLPVLAEGTADHAGAVCFVQRAQALIKAVGEIKGLDLAACQEQTGTFDTATKTALQQVQASWNVAADGICGPIGWSILVTGSVP